MFQQIIALIVILYFLSRLIIQKYRNKISFREFIFWLVFWVVSACLILSIKYIDTAVAKLGFSGTGIQILLYLAVAVIFYLLFRLNIKIAKLENDITKIVREIALKNK